MLSLVLCIVQILSFRDLESKGFPPSHRLLVHSFLVLWGAKSWSWWLCPRTMSKNISFCVCKFKWNRFIRYSVEVLDMFGLEFSAKLEIRIQVDLSTHSYLFWPRQLIEDASFFSRVYFWPLHQKSDGCRSYIKVVSSTSLIKVFVFMPVPYCFYYWCITCRQSSSFTPKCNLKSRELILAGVI